MELIKRDIRREYGIDWLKTIAIIFVIFTHCQWTTEECSLMLFPFWIDMAVPIFMIITGYNYYNSLKRIGGGQTSQFIWYIKNFLRIFVPFVFVIIIETVLMCILDYTLESIVLNIITGGIGPGSYYTIVLLQIIVMYPLLYRIVNSKYGFWVILLANLLFEVIVSTIEMNRSIYGLLSLRYLSFLAVGAEYAKLRDSITRKKDAWIGMITFVLGILCVWILNYSGIELVIFKQWTVTSMPTVFLAFSWFVLLSKVLTMENKLVEVISKSSFHIFLVQMVYYFSLENVLHKIVPFPNEFVAFIINLSICLGCGILFYYFEKKITKNIFGGAFNAK